MWWWPPAASVDLMLFPLFPLQPTMNLKFYFWLVLLRCNLHTVRFTNFKREIDGVLTNAKGSVTMTTIMIDIFIIPKCFLVLFVLATTDLLSITISFVSFSVSYKWNHTGSSRLCFFHLAYCFEYSSMLPSVIVFHSFLLLIIPLYECAAICLYIRSLKSIRIVSRFW